MIQTPFKGNRKLTPLNAEGSDKPLRRTHVYRPSRIRKLLPQPERDCVICAEFVHPWPVKAQNGLTKGGKTRPNV